MARGKHSLHSYNNTYEDYENGDTPKGKTIITIVMVIVVIAIVTFSVIYIKNSNETQENVENSNTVIETNTVAGQMIDTHQGYNVLGKIVIEEFDIDQYILDSKEDNALESGVIKLYGGNLNNYGNFCIAGHNKTEVFEKLNEMEIEDTFKIIEPDLSETTYRITEIYSSEADDLKCLLQNEEKVEITLITCENASTTRLIVKAEKL